MWDTPIYFSTLHLWTLLPSHPVVFILLFVDYNCCDAQDAEGGFYKSGSRDRIDQSLIITRTNFTRYKQEETR
jgi:hypothetical protein